jgi:hypothetical protein
MILSRYRLLLMLICVRESVRIVGPLNGLILILISPDLFCCGRRAPQGPLIMDDDPAEGDF